MRKQNIVVGQLLKKCTHSLPLPFFQHVPILKSCNWTAWQTQQTSILSKSEQSFRKAYSFQNNIWNTVPLILQKERFPATSMASTKKSPICIMQTRSVSIGFERAGRRLGIRNKRNNALKYFTHACSYQSFQKSLLKPTNQNRNLELLPQNTPHKISLEAFIPL